MRYVSRSKFTIPHHVGSNDAFFPGEMGKNRLLETRRRVF